MAIYDDWKNPTEPWGVKSEADDSRVIDGTGGPLCCTLVFSEDGSGNPQIRCSEDSTATPHGCSLSFFDGGTYDGSGGRDQITKQISSTERFEMKRESAGGTVTITCKIFKSDPKSEAESVVGSWTAEEGAGHTLAEGLRSVDRQADRVSLAVP
jgi:hypothetical protein